MYGQILGVSTITTGVTGVALLPNTGSTRVLFVAAAAMLVVGIVTLAVSSVITFKQRRATNA